MSDDNIAVRDIRNAGWFWIQNEIILTYGPKIGAYGVAVYNVLAQCARNESSLSKTTMRQIATLLDISPQSAMRSLEKLIQHGLVREVKKSLSPSQGPSEYALLSVPIGNGGNGSVPIGNASVPVGNGSVPIGNTYKTSNTNKTKEEVISNPSLKEEFSLVGEELIDHKKKLSKKEIQEFALAFNPPERIPRGPWDAWIEMRIEKNNCPTPRAIHMAIAEMDRLVGEGSDYAAIMNKSTIAGYPGLYAATNGKPNSNGNGFHNGQQSRTNGPGATGHLLDHLPDADEIARRRKADDARLEARRNARGM